MSSHATGINAGHDNGHTGGEEGFHPHIIPLKVYFAVWGALVFLTVVTVAVSYVDFNAMLGIKNVNLVVAMIVAVTKALLVATFFMHLKYENRLNTVVFMSSIIFLAIFFLLTFADLMTRGQVDEFQGTFVKTHGQRNLTPPPAAHTAPAGTTAPSGEQSH